MPRYTKRRKQLARLAQQKVQARLGTAHTDEDEDEGKGNDTNSVNNGSQNMTQPAFSQSIQQKGILPQNQSLDSLVSRTLPLPTPQTPKKKLPPKAPTGKKRGRPPSPWDTQSDRSKRRNVQQFTTQLEG